MFSDAKTPPFPAKIPPLPNYKNLSLPDFNEDDVVKRIKKQNMLKGKNGWLLKVNIQSTMHRQQNFLLFL